MAASVALPIPRPESVDGLTPPVLAATRAHPNFRASVEQHCAGRVSAQLGMDDLSRWMTRDIGRYSLAAALAILDGQPGGVTVAALFQAAQANATASRGRVTKFSEQAQAEGGLAIPAGDEHWTRRRLIVRPKLIEPLMAHSSNWLRSAALVFPELEACFDRLDDPAWMVPHMTVGAVLAMQAQYLITPSDKPMALFIGRDGGMAIFCDLFCRQNPERSRLLEVAPLSRKGLAARTAVSRTQIQRLLSDGADQGLLSASRDEVRFTETMSEDAERHFALTLQLTRLSVSLVPQALAYQATRNAAREAAEPARGARLAEPLHASATLADGGSPP